MPIASSRVVQPQTTCPSCGRRLERGYGDDKGSSTSARAARVYAEAEERWFRSALRRRIPDCQRQTWRRRFCARAVTLTAFWRTLR